MREHELQEANKGVGDRGLSQRSSDIPDKSEGNWREKQVLDIENYKSKSMWVTTETRNERMYKNFTIDLLTVTSNRLELG